MAPIKPNSAAGMSGKFPLRGGAMAFRLGSAKPAKPTTISPKEQQKLAKVDRLRRQAMDFLFRQLATITYRFNLFFIKELTGFAKAMNDGDELRSQLKLKKSDKPRIWNIRTMLEAADLLDAAKQTEEADHLRTLADLSGRTRTWGLVAADIQKWITGKESDEISDRMKSFLDSVRGFQHRVVDYSEEMSFMMKSLLDSLQGFTNRNADFSVLKYVYKVDLSEYTELEKTYLMWPVAVRTALFNGAQFLKMVSDESVIPLLPTTDPTYMLRYMQPAEFVLMLNMSDELTERGNTDQEKKMALLLGKSAKTAKKETWQRPNVDNVEPELLQPIAPKSLLLQYPQAEDPMHKQGKQNKDKRRK